MVMVSGGLYQRTESTACVKIVLYTQVLVHNIQSFDLPNNCQHTSNQEEWRLAYLKPFTFDLKALNATCISASLLIPPLSLLIPLLSLLIRPHWKPQVSPPREAKAGSHGGKGQQTLRLTLLPDEDGALSDRPVSGLDHPPPRRHLLCQYSIQTRSIYSRTAPNGDASRRLCGRPSSKRPRSFRAPPGAGTARTSRSCSPTSGVARRCSSF